MKLTGLIPPVVTPFDKQGNLDLKALQKFLGQLEPYVDGFLVLGSTSETPYLEETERDQVISAARETIPKTKPMLVGTGAESTRATVQRSQVAQKLGADALLVVADAVDVPVYIYNIPQVTGITHSSQWLASTATHPNVAGMKDSSGDIMTLTETLRLVPPTFNALTGNAPTLLPALSVGVQGAILAVANVAPEACKAVMTAFERGELREARALQYKLNPLAYAVTRDYGIAGLKAVARARGFSVGYPRAPLQDVSSEDLKRLEKMLAELVPREAVIR
jgi:4-hydroxy-2-oxoglutarate aldolase